MQEVSSCRLHVGRDFAEITATHREDTTPWGGVGPWLRDDTSVGLSGKNQKRCVRFDPTEWIHGIQNASMAADFERSSRALLEVREGPLLWSITGGSGSISGLQRPLLGRNSRGSGGSARGHTSITREIITDSK